MSINMSTKKKLVVTIQEIKGFDQAQEMVAKALEDALSEDWEGQLNNGWCTVKWHYEDAVAENGTAQTAIKNIHKMLEG
jgi:bisphosphoglycerate-independent phosphoglycerate mutase (AlkP superfamily)